MSVACELTTNRQSSFLPDVLLAMGDREFSWWTRCLEARTGVVIPPARRTFLESNLRVRMRETGHESFQDYYNNALVGRNGAVEWATLIDRLTVHKTEFFRHSPSLELVAKEVEDAVSRASGVFEYNAWSVGCATGEEVYSLAMVIDYATRTFTGRRVYSVTGTDVSLPALEVARTGRFDLDRLTEVPEPYRGSFCHSYGREFLVEKRLQRRVAFALLNLLEIAQAPLTGLNLIFCQNVLIYFPRDRRRTLLDQMADLLAPGGVLILGPGEVLSWSHPTLERIESRRTLAYRRRNQGGVAQ